MISYMCLHINDKGIPVDDMYDSGARLKLGKIHLFENRHILCQDTKPTLGNIEPINQHGNGRLN